ncbi:MAG TPA: NUDIX hydrolase [Anaerolineae bacterium]|nr:NUDIX hydrolase [Anaerolineae bacterium]
MATGGAPRWLAWAQQIQAIAQTGLTYCENEYEKERYTHLMRLAAEIVHEHAGLAEAHVVEDFFSQPGYATPKVDVRAAVVHEGRILLVRERVDGLWTMPGGWADVGDAPSEMVVRETREESGYEVEPVKLVGVFDANRSGEPLSFYHAYKLVFLCRIVGGEAQTSHETLGVEFFELDELPALSSNRTNERHLDEVRAHLADAARPAYFD